jgi:hypothetical protein
MTLCEQVQYNVPDELTDGIQTYQIRLVILVRYRSTTNRALEELYAQKLGENLKVAVQYHLLAQVKQYNSACCHVYVA